MSDDSTTTRISDRFCHEDSDVTFKSSDGVLFQIHRKNLETHALGFPPSEFDVLDEIVPLTEDSSTLELLFQFIYPQHQPDLKRIPAKTFISLAEAAEKYEVFCAMNICMIHMSTILLQHPSEVMLYAVKHNYPELLQEAALHLLNKPWTEVIADLPDNLVIPWVRYYENWRETLASMLSQFEWNCESTTEHNFIRNHQSFSQHMNKCCWCGCNLDVVFSQLARKVMDARSLTALDTLVENLQCCDHAVPDIRSWNISLKNKMRNLPTFETFLY